ncbi:MAG: DUF11 domain-containing protein [Cytophagaceae bacterium]|nr:DUF11 domain-containing protein [Cytophagaceae bacterium]
MPANINTGNPNFPFPQFKAYTGGANTLANQNPVGIPHAEMEQRTRDAYAILCNNLTYYVNQNGTYANLTVNGVRYIMPNEGNGNSIAHCTCVEGDGYNLLAAAYMADKATFDGYYMWAHDRMFQKTVRFSDNVMNSAGYNYSPGIAGAGSFGASTNVYGGALGGNSAADGDVDLALALLVAWKQWGDAGVICNDPQLGVITYRNEAIKYIRTMVDTLKYTPSLPIARYITGIIGLDGYMKGGDSWSEETNWATGGYMGMVPLATGPQTNYVDYHAPAYFRAFGDMLQAEGISPWCQSQYRRAEASCDWVMGQAFAQGRIPWIGQYGVTGAAVTFSAFNAGGEDFRYGWRTIMNHMWFGAPTRNWDPNTHAVTAGTNSYNLNMANRMAALLHYPENPPFNNACYVGNTIQYGGTSNVRWEYSMTGTAGGAFVLNMPQGSQSPSAVVADNWDLMSQMFRQCVIDYDDYLNPGPQRYLTAEPRYFHDFFRLLGMLVLTGNFHNPMNFAAASTQSNMKVYKAVNKTFAYPGDTITYTISYRNYSKQGATGVTITDNLPAGTSFVSASNGGTAAGSTVTWNIGNVPGFVTGGLAATQGSVTLRVKVDPAASGRLCNVATIATTNGTGWTSNEYPNNITDVMERNCVDILSQKPVSITKTASLANASPGDVITYTITVKNRSVPFLNGGRQGVIVASAHSGITASQNALMLKYRVYHGAHEPYINYRNYRVSYYLNKTPIPTWVNNVTINEGNSGTLPTLTQQTLTPGATWNHRFILTFPNQRATITPMLYARYNSPIYIHEGAMEPMRLVNQIRDVGWTNYNFLTDWSAEAGLNVADGHPYFPIANDWTDPLLPNQPVTKIHPNQCGTITTTVQRQLVEEWDGYTWRRAYGNAPVSGRELTNVVVKDILPSTVTFGGYTAGYPAGTLSAGTITWPTIPQMLINDSIVYRFWVTVNPCPGSSPIINTATAKADNEPLETATASTNFACALPVSLIDFKGKMQHEDAVLTWTTESEQNNDYFNVERSLDGNNFVTIGQVDGNGNSNSTINYNYTDRSVSGRIIYYRLAQYNFDGTVHYTKVISVSNDNSMEVLIYPNPFTEGTTLKVLGKEGEKISVRIVTATGVEVYYKEHNVNEEVSLGSELASGVYFVQVVSVDITEVLKLVKNK